MVAELNARNSSDAVNGMVIRSFIGGMYAPKWGGLGVGGRSGVFSGTHRRLQDPWMRQPSAEKKYIVKKPWPL